MLNSKRFRLKTHHIPDDDFLVENVSKFLAFTHILIIIIIIIIIVIIILTIIIIIIIIQKTTTTTTITVITIIIIKIMIMIIIIIIIITIIQLTSHNFKPSTETKKIRVNKNLSYRETT